MYLIISIVNNFIFIVLCVVALILKATKGKWYWSFYTIGIAERAINIFGALTLAARNPGMETENTFNIILAVILIVVFFLLLHKKPSDKSEEKPPIGKI